MVDTEGIRRLGYHVKEVIVTLSHLVVKPNNSSHADQAETVRSTYREFFRRLREK